jgi:hypothetical protein
VGLLQYGSGCNQSMTLSRNYFAHIGNRVPWIAAGWHTSAFNNVSYDANASAGDEGSYGFWQIVGTGDYWECPTDLAAISNVAVSGPHTIQPDAMFKINFDSRQVTLGGASHIYLKDNQGPAGQFTVAGSSQPCTGTTATQQWERCMAFTPGSAGTRANSEAVQAYYDASFTWHHQHNYQIMAASLAVAYVQAHSGFRPYNRPDATDSRLLLDVTQLDGSYATSEASVGGYPVLANNSRPLLASIPASPFSVATGQTFRTNIEMWLETCAREVEDGVGTCVP